MIIGLKNVSALFLVLSVTFLACKKEPDSNVTYPTVAKKNIFYFDTKTVKKAKVKQGEALQTVDVSTKFILPESEVDKTNLINDYALEVKKSDLVKDNDTFYIGVRIVGADSLSSLSVKYTESEDTVSNVKFDFFTQDKTKNDTQEDPLNKDLSKAAGSKRATERKLKVDELENKVVTFAFTAKDEVNKELTFTLIGIKVKDRTQQVVTFKVNIKD